MEWTILSLCTYFVWLQAPFAPSETLTPLVLNP